MLIGFSSNNSTETNQSVDYNFAGYIEKDSINLIDFKVNTPKPGTSTVPSVTQTPTPTDETPSTNSPASIIEDIDQPFLTVFWRTMQVRL